MDKKEFTFVAFTYNQEKYIIQQLYSIKYQIEHYGNDYDIHFLLCDDASKDRTVELVKKWMEEHRDLFVNIKFVVHKQNVGIVGNFLSALKNIDTKKFKILAGDDVYYKNNVFIVNENSNFCISPILGFGDNLTVNKSDLLYYNMLLYKQCKCYDVKKFLQECLKYQDIISAPGVFFEFNDCYDDIANILTGYKFIEDVQTWTYLLTRSDTKVEIFEIPYVMYRCDVGVSTNKNNSKHEDFIKDYKRINKEVYVNRLLKPSILNPHKWKNSIYKILSRNVYAKNSYVKDVNKAIRIAEEDAPKYLKNIVYSADCWMKNKGFN